MYEKFVSYVLTWCSPSQVERFVMDHNVKSVSFVLGVVSPRYKDWYRKRHGKGFDYYLEWPGFNVPSWVLNDLRDGKAGSCRPLRTGPGCRVLVHG